MDEKDDILKEDIEKTHSEHPWYWKRRIWWSLGWSAVKSKRLMKKFNIEALVKKRKKYSKPWDIWLPDANIPNLTKDLVIENPFKLWRTDFTFLNYKWIMFYLATVLDVYTREIVWYCMWYNHTQEFVLEALKDAIQKTKNIPEIFHSDQWSEYRSFYVLEYLSKMGISPSMSKKASPWENWHQESYYSKFKLEIWNLNKHDTFEKAVEAIHHRIYYYNNDRIHTALRMPPKMYHERYKLIQKRSQENILKS
jgi:transposase InsO family protein